MGPAGLMSDKPVLFALITHLGVDGEGARHPTAMSRRAKRRWRRSRRGRRGWLTKLGSIAWHPPPCRPSLLAMRSDREDHEFWTPEPLSFAQVRAELLAVVMRNHPEFSLEQAQEMLREAGL